MQKKGRIKKRNLENAAIDLMGFWWQSINNDFIYKIYFLIHLSTLVALCQSMLKLIYDGIVINRPFSLLMVIEYYRNKKQKIVLHPI